MLTRKDFVEKTIQQINKDFPPILEPIPKNTPAEHVFDHLSVRLEFLLKECKEKVPQYIYQVDLPESKVNKLFETNFNKIIIKLTELILEREAQKVYLKLKWSDAS